MNKFKITLFSTIAFAVFAFAGTIILSYIKHPQNKHHANEHAHGIDGHTKPYSHLGGDFTLQSAEGKLSLADFKGKLVILYFGFINCPDICPASLARIAHALKQLTEAQQQQIQTLMISVDPERDTPEMLKNYVEPFNPGFIGLVGDPQEIKRIALSYGAYAHTTHTSESAEPRLDHTTKIYLLNRQGEVIKMFDHDILPDKLAEEIKGLI